MFAKNCLRFLFFIPPLIDGAGFTTHNTAVRRASQFEYFGPKTKDYDPKPFQGLAMSRADAIQGGAPYPDYLYTCGTDHDAGEEAHWTPFQIAAANYIRDKYPHWAKESRNMHGPGLVAFMLGVTSHYIADMNWHGLETVPSGEGIIRTMGFADFNCTNGDLCQIAHTAADTGGEFAAAMSLNISWHPQGKWLIPTSDLVNIYSMLNIEVQESWINECAVIFYAGSFAVSRLGDIIYEYIIAPRVGGLLLEEYVDFPVGGVDDMAAWTGFMWNRFAEWVSGGPPDVPPNSPVHPSVHGGGENSQGPPAQDKKANKIRRRLSQRNFATAIRQVLEAQGVLPLPHPGVASTSIASSTASSTPHSAHSSGVNHARASNDDLEGIGHALTGSLFEVTYDTTGVYSNGTTPGRATYVSMRSQDSLRSDPIAAAAMKDKDRSILRLLSDALVEEYALQMWHEDAHFTDPQRSRKSRRLKIEIDDDVMLQLRIELYARLDSYLDLAYPTTAAYAAPPHTPPSDQAQAPQPAANASVTVSRVASGSAPHEYFGASITVADFSARKDGSKCDVLVGSYGAGRPGGHQEGAARILFNAACAVEMGTYEGDYSFRGGMMHDTDVPSYERFGWSSAAIDVNGDGSIDAVLCAPSFGGRNVTEVVGNYTGRCDIFYGPFSPSALAQSVQSVQPASLSANPPKPDVSIYGDAMWGMFGYFTSVGDLDGDGFDDLVVSAPGAGSYSSVVVNDRGDVSSQGAVFVFLASSLRSLIQQRTATSPHSSFLSLVASDTADFTLQRQASFQYFGRSLEIVEAPQRLLLVGAPFFHFENEGEDKTSAAGRIFAYSFAQQKSQRSSLRRSVADKAPKDYEWSITGCLHAGRTGQTMAYSKTLSVLAIGEPAFNGTSRNPYTLGKSILRSGRVVLVPLQSLLDHASSGLRDMRMCDIEGWLETSVVAGDEKEARFGNTIAFLSAPITHTSVASTDSKNAVGSMDQLVIAGSLGSKGAGSVSGIEVSKSGSKVTARPKWTITGSDSIGEAKGRLGYRIVPFVSKGTNSSYSVFSSAPFANCGGAAPDGDQLGQLVIFVSA